MTSYIAILLLLSSFLDVLSAPISQSAYSYYNAAITVKNTTAKLTINMDGDHLSCRLFENVSISEENFGTYKKYYIRNFEDENIKFENPKKAFMLVHAVYNGPEKELKKFVKVLCRTRAEVHCSHNAIKTSKHQQNSSSSHHRHKPRVKVNIDQVVGWIDKLNINSPITTIHQMCG